LKRLDQIGLFDSKAGFHLADALPDLRQPRANCFESGQVPQSFSIQGVRRELAVQQCPSLAEAVVEIPENSFDLADVSQDLRWPVGLSAVVHDDGS
jgi:hypothetical protein